MPIHAVENHRLYRQIADQLSALIASGEFSYGQRLPSERDLAAQLGVSRPSVREALIALELEGKVDVRVGAGIFVAVARPAAVAFPTAEGQGPFELIRARWLIEGEVAAEAARRARPDDFHIVRRAVEEMHQGQLENRETEIQDRDFHLGIAAATHNSVLVSAVRDLWDRGRVAIWKRMEHHFRTPELRDATLADHRAILEALVSEDARAARAAMRRHLERVDREFSRSWEQLKEADPPEDASTASSSTPRLPVALARKSR